MSAFILVPKLMGQIGDAVAQAPVYSASIGVWTWAMWRSATTDRSHSAPGGRA